MRPYFSLAVTLGLTCCTSASVSVTAGRCWAASAGDGIKGTAILYVASPFTFHVGPKVGGRSEVSSLFGKIFERCR
jgi:hypothetical protein